MYMKNHIKTKVIHIFFSQIPIFVQILDPRQNYYMGMCEGKGTRTEFEMVHLKRTPPHCKYLTGKQLHTFGHKGTYLDIGEKYIERRDFLNQSDNYMQTYNFHLEKYNLNSREKFKPGLEF